MKPAEKDTPITITPSGNLISPDYFRKDKKALGNQASINWL